MITVPFQKVQQELETKLKAALLGHQQDGVLEQAAQQVADKFFKVLKRKGAPVVLDNSGIEITGCVLAFDIGRVMVGSWTTKFYPHDIHAVVDTVPGAIAMGYVNGYQLYLAPQKGLPHTLVARFGMGPAYQTWSPAHAGVPGAANVHFVTLERAKALGYLHLLQVRH
jgi:hypothetical protein